MKNKKVTTTLVILLAAVFVIVFATYVGVFNFSTYDELVIKPTYGVLRCAPDNSDSYYPGPEGWEVDVNTQFGVLCGNTENTDSCEIYAKSKDVGWVADSVRFCITSKTGSCNVGTLGVEFGDNQEKLIATISNEQKLVMQFCGDAFCSVPKGMSWYKKYKAWKIFRVENGKLTTAVSNSCTLTSETAKGAKSGIPIDSYRDQLLFEGGEGIEWINYISGWTPGVSEKLYKHETYGDVYCSSGELYKATKIELVDGRIVVIDPESTNNTIYSAYGDMVDRVECCPHEPNCELDFTRSLTGGISGNVKADGCTFNTECLNSGAPFPDGFKLMTQEKCINGKCIKQEPWEVDCQIDSHCKAGYVCSKFTYTCITSKGLSGYCGDGICSVLETDVPGREGYCPSDCGTKGYSKDDIDDEYNIWLIVGIVVGLLLMILITFSIKRKGNTGMVY